jgi:very-short-patch-repair endonuclease
MNYLAKTQLKQYRTATGYKKKDDESNRVQLFTKLEQSLYTLILNLNIPLPFYAQTQAGPSMEYQIDAAFPSIRLGIEADSETFHASPDQIAKDRHRDSVLAGEGWTILRFTDRELKQKQQEVSQVILQVVQQLMSQLNPQ